MKGVGLGLRDAPSVCILDAPATRPGAPVFVASRAPWYSITDGRPRHDGHATSAGPVGP